MIDSHCHPDFPQFDGDRAEMLVRAAEAGVTAIMAVGIGSGGPRPDVALKLAEQAQPGWPKIYATTGIHPTSAPLATPELLDEVEQLSRDPRVLAIGEIGMDFHRRDSNPGVPADVQERVFIRQMEIARAARKPIVIHSRDAWPESLALLREHWASSGLGGILHCFSGMWDVAQAGMDMGFLISIAGPVTFPKATELREVAGRVPLDRLLIETDAPYLAPVPHRGKRNEPAFVAEVCKTLTAIHHLSPAEMDAQTTANFERLLIH